LVAVWKSGGRFGFLPDFLALAWVAIANHYLCLGLYEFAIPLQFFKTDLIQWAYKGKQSATILMSQANLDLFLAEARKDLALSNKLRAAKSHEELLNLATEHGHDLTKATVLRHHLHRLAGRSDAELEALADSLFNDDFGSVFLGKLV
jgi:predicted ribosomally synthesized peptide with nif11-like leader